MPFRNNLNALCLHLMETFGMIVISHNIFLSSFGTLRGNRTPTSYGLKAARPAIRRMRARSNFAYIIPLEEWVFPFSSACYCLCYCLFI